MYHFYLQPSLDAVVPLLVPKDKIVVANGMFNIAESILGLAGPTIAGIILGFFGPWVGIMLNSLSFLISILFLKKIHSHFTLVKKPGVSRYNFAADLNMTYKYLKKESWFLHGLLLVGAVYLSTGSVGSILQFFFLKYLNLSGFWFGFTFVLFEFVPVLLVSYTAPVILKRFTTTAVMQISSIFFCFSMIIMGLSLNYIIVVFAGMLQNGSSALLMISWISKRQSSIPNNLLGKINGVVMTVQSFLLPLGGLLSTLLIKFVVVPKILLSFGTFSLVWIIITIITKKKKNKF